MENCKYSSVANCGTHLGWQLCDDDDGVDWNVYWMDCSCSAQRVMKLHKHQKINHFPGMRALSHKVPLAKNMMRMVRAFPGEFQHVPKSWALPAESKLFRRKFSTKTGNALSKKTYILKPDHSCQGKGIVLCRTWDQVTAAVAALRSASGEGVTASMVAQEYIGDPLLIEGHKFDLRVYVLVLSVDPLRVMLYDDGLVRICAVPYKKPSAKAVRDGFDRTAHLTNYAVNKKHADFEFNDDEDATGVGNKRTIKWFREWVTRTCRDNPDPATPAVRRLHTGTTVWTAVADLVNRTLLSVQPQLAHQYRTVIPDPEDDGFTCFELLGFDVMFRANMSPVLVEVNHGPSLTCDTPLDKAIKYGVLTETMRLLKVSGADKRKEQARTAASAQSRLYAGSKKESTGSGERETLAREAGLAKRMRQRRAYERKHMVGFHIIHPTDEAVTWATRQQATLTEEALAGAGNGGNVGSGDLQNCLDPSLLHSLGRPYKQFRDAAAVAFAEQTLGASPGRKGPERELLSSWTSGRVPEAQHPHQRNGHSGVQPPAVTGAQLSPSAAFDREYRGERERRRSSSLLSSGRQPFHVKTAGATQLLPRHHGNPNTGRFVQAAAPFPGRATCTAIPSCSGRTARSATSKST